MAIKKLVFFLVVVCAIALGAVWMVLSPAPVPTQEAEVPAKRTLAYEQAISQPREEKAADDEESSKKDDIPAFDTVTREEAPKTAGDPPAIQDIPADGETDTSEVMAALPDEGASAQDNAALPPLPGEEGADQWGTDGAEQWGDERGQDQAYGQPRPADPYGQGEPYDPYADPYARDPNAPPGQQDAYGPPPGDPYATQDPYGPPQQEPWGADPNAEQWVQVTISGSPMRATASEDAAMLFAFPYGRKLKVVSRHEGWVEVTDPKSAATGWMQAHTLAPSRENANDYGQAYEEEPRRRRRGLFGGGGIADMINRAFGGGGY